MSRPAFAALMGLLFLAACASSGDVVSSRNDLSPVFVPSFDAGAPR